ncbi:unnamed protein product [Cunninghamella blakesleeana]
MTSFDIAHFPTIKLVKIVSDLLESICIANEGIPCKQLSGFHSRAVPRISIETYMTRILKYTPFTNEVLLCMLIYFDRIAIKQKNMININFLNIHRFIITSIVVATKSTSDIYYRNSRYAKVGGISIDELFRLEFELLELCDYLIHVPLDELQNYANQLWNLTLQKNDPKILTVLLPSSPPVMRITSPIPTFQPTSQALSTESSLKPTSHLQKSTCSILPLTPPYENPSIHSSKPKKYIPRSHPYTRPSSLSY